MRKDLKKTGLFALVVFSFLAFVVYEINSFKDEEEVKEVKDRVVKVESAKINRVETENFIFEKTGYSWRALEGPFIDLLSKSLVEDWLAKAVSQDGRALSEKDEEVRWHKFGFKDDSQAITLKSDEKSVKITLSEMKSFDGGSYLKVSEGKDTAILYSSGSSWFEFFDKNFNALRDQNAFNWDMLEKKSMLTGFSVAKSSTSKGPLNLLVDNNVWLSKQDSYKSWGFDQAKVTSFIDDVKKHKVLKFLDEKPEGLVKYGSLSFKTDQKDKYTLRIYKKGQEFFANNSFRPSAFFSLEKDNINTFFPEPYYLRSFNDALSFNQDALKSTSYKKGSKSYNFSKKDSGVWRLYKNAPEGMVFNEASVLKLFSLMKNIKPERYFVRKPYLSGEPDLSVLRKNNKGKYQSFRIYKKEYSCVEGEDKKDCYALVSNGQILAIKKNEIKEILKLGFFKKASEIVDKGPLAAEDKTIEAEVKTGSSKLKPTDQKTSEVKNVSE